MASIYFESDTSVQLTNYHKSSVVVSAIPELMIYGWSSRVARSVQPQLLHRDPVDIDKLSRFISPADMMAM